jgi:ketosteroid isomerase-like protein
MEPQDLHRRVEEAFNRGDVDALVALYERDARMLRDDGTAAVGLDAIREVWQGFVNLGGRITMTTRSAVEAGDIALLSNSYTSTFDGMEFGATTAEVARRGPDGTWRYLIDNPFAGPAQA